MIILNEHYNVRILGFSWFSFKISLSNSTSSPQCMKNLFLLNYGSDLLPYYYLVIIRFNFTFGLFQSGPIYKHINYDNKFIYEL
jgi:hypothetical protein